MTVLPSTTARSGRLRTAVISAVVGLTMALAGTVAQPASGNDAPVEVQILSLTDLHGYLSDSENLTIAGANGPIKVGGAGHLKAHVDRLAATADNSFLIGSGDQFTGWPDYTEAFANEPTIEVLNALGMDFDVAGNHEFDRELPFLRRMVNGSCQGVAEFDSCFRDSAGRPFHGTDYGYHAANVVHHGTDRSVLPSSWVTEVPKPGGGTISVGFIGLTFPHTHEESLSISSTLDFQPVIDAGNRVAAELQAQGVETIVVSMHEGGQQDGGFDECRNPRGPIFDAARQLSPAVDAILGGHWHTAFACSVPGPDGVARPVVEASNHGRLLGEVRLLVDPATGDVLPDRSEVTNHPVTKDIPADPTVSGIVQYWEDRWAERQGEPIGNFDRDLDFRKDAESRMGNLAADLYHRAAEPGGNGAADLALVPPDIGIDVVSAGLTHAAGSHPNDAPGRILFGEAWQAMGISPIVTVSLTGAQIDAILEEQWLPPAYGCQRRASIAVSKNVRVTADLGQPVGNRIGADSVRIDGSPLDPDRLYRVATTSILVLHGRTYGYPTFQQGTDLVRAPKMGKDVWLEHLRRNRGTSVPEVGRTTLLPGEPPVSDGPFGPLRLLPQSEMTATATSQGNAAHGPASALDGNCGTMWHSAWSPRAPMPQSITLDLGQSRDLSALVYTPRQDASLNGRIGRYEVQVSDDGAVFRVATTGTWDGTVDAKIARLPEGTSARYVRLVGVEGGADYAAATEINIALR